MRSSIISTLGVVAVSACATEIAEPPEPMVGDATDLAVMTINARIVHPDDVGERSWQQRLPRIVGVVDEASGAPDGADLIGFQELTSYDGGSMLDDLLAAMPRFESRSVDRGDGERIAIFVRADRLEVLGAGSRMVTTTQRDQHCTILDQQDRKPRAIQYVLVRDRATNRTTYFYNVHFPTGNSCGRLGMAEAVADYIAARADRSARVILGGDFNDGIEADGHVNSSFEYLLAATGLAMAVHPSQDFMTCTTASGVCSSAPAWDKERRDGQQIDHLLVSSPDDVVAGAIDRSMFRLDPVATRVPCAAVEDGRCDGLVPFGELALYSDHWSLWATLKP